MERPLINFGSSINMSSWTVLFGQIYFKNNTMFGISIFGCKTVRLSIIARCTSETREKADWINWIVLLSYLFWAYNSSPNRDLSLLIRQRFVIIIKELYHCCVISLNILELRVSHGNINGVICGIVGICLNHTLKAAKLIKLFVITKLVE